MNIMRKLRNNSTQSSTSNPNSSSPSSATMENNENRGQQQWSSEVGGASGTASTHDNSPSSQHVQLGLSHLKKLFAEYSHLKEPTTDLERDQKLYVMLPLFCKVFGSCHATDMSEKFWDILAFTQQVSRLIVSEIRRRASNQSTEAASIAIVKFLEIETCEESSNGWMLLSTLNQLAAGDASIIQVMTQASVPSTLVKCLYLFFDLPEIEDGDEAAEGSEFTANERRILLQKVFVQLLVRLCSYPYPAEELARMDDLTLLFSAITSQCPVYNILWRKSSAEVLTTLSRHGLTDPVVNYIHSKGCVALSLENIQRSQQLSPLEMVEMFVAVFCFLKDSSEVSQRLLDDFRASQGYAFLVEFLVKLDNDRRSGEGDVTACDEIEAATRNLILMIVSLCMCGFVELRPNQSHTSSIFQLQGFQIPQISTRGSSVRNIHAFWVLQTVFFKSTSSDDLCCTILDAISNVYHSDNANYFILEPHNTLSQFTERIHLKSGQIQEKFFALIEYIVFQLNFVPCKELISCSILLKTNHSTQCSIACMKSLLRILRFNSVFKDVFCEVGILEVFVTCLQRFHAHCLEREKRNSDGDRGGEQEADENAEEEAMGKLAIEALTVLLYGNNNNAKVFRECGGSKCAHEMIHFEGVREPILTIIRELILSANGEDDLLFLLSTMHSAPPENFAIKCQILNVLLGCLRDSHRTRTLFRKVGGFLYVTSVFVSLDGKLTDSFAAGATSSSLNHLLQLLHMACQTLVTAMRFEPANAKFFHQEICTTSFCDTLRLLGCFNTNRELGETPLDADDDDTHFINAFHRLFLGSTLKPELNLEEIPIKLTFICLIFRLLYDCALDNFDKCNLSGVLNIAYCGGAVSGAVSSVNVSAASQSGTNNGEPSQQTTARQEMRSSLPSLNLNQTHSEPLIVHPGIVICMLQLLPSIEYEPEPEKALVLQTYLAEVLKSLVRSERNQQIMCGVGMATHLLTIGEKVLSEEQNQLHVPLQYMLERLAAQALQPTEVRSFLRLGQPLHCRSPSMVTPYKPGGPIPLTRIKTLVSMTTPRDFRAQGSCTLPPFVELDMSSEGFGCLYLPSIAPQAPHNGGNMDANNIGGIGSGDRVFPAQIGLTYSTWFCVDKFSDSRTDPHSVRLLTIIRTVCAGPREDHLVCLTMLLSARDKAIIVSTQETLVPSNAGEWEPDGTGESGARIWCPDLLHEGQWHHLVAVFNRAVLKNSSFSLYLDGQHMHTQKLHYISQNPGSASANLTVASAVYAFIGTPPAWRRYSRLTWKQGSCHLVEDVLSAQTVSVLYQLGPHYMGSLQSPQLGRSGDSCLGSLVPEERLVFGLNAKAISHLTLAKIRKVYSRTDNKTIAKQLGISSHDNATPIRILHNSAGHLAGASRTLGGVVVGYLGVRIFCPQPVSSMIETVGGCNVLLGIVGMTQDVESLYAAVKALTCVVRTNQVAQVEMDRKRCYQTLAMFFKRKRNLLNSHILHLTFSLVGTVNSGQETSAAIPNVTAFQDLLCDLEVWQHAPNGLLKSLLEHLLELASESSEKRANVRIMRDLQLMSKLLQLLDDQQQQQQQEGPTLDILFALVHILLGGHNSELLLFGQFVATKLPARSLETETGLKPRDFECLDGSELGALCKKIVLRNHCLSILHSLLFTPRNTVNVTVCDDITRILGMDWLLLFVQPQVHYSTVIWAMRILVVLCANETLIARFKDATHNGGYLRNTELVSQHNSINVLTPQLSPSLTGVAGSGSASGVGMTGTSTGGGSGGSSSALPPSKVAAEVRTSILHIPGFQYLEWLLPHHLHISDLYYLVLALIMGQPVKGLVSDSKKLDLDKVWAFLWGGGVSMQQSSSILPKISFCPEAVCILMAMIRKIVNMGGSIVGPHLDWMRNHPETLVQIMFSLYQNLPDFMPVMMMGDVIASLASVLFPYGQPRTPGSATTAKDSSSPTSPTSERAPEPSSPNPGLITHPVRKFVVDFLRVIVVDSLSLSPTSMAGGGKATPVIDLVLEGGAAEFSSLDQQTTFQTEIITALMDHLLAADVLVGEQAALPIVPLLQSHVSHVAPNVFYLTARIVDKLWQGQLNKDPHEVFDFVVQLIGQCKRRSSAYSLEQLHHSLNRTILYLLSRPLDSVAQQMACLEALHKLTTNRLLIFGAGNHELDFVGCLTYCLLQLTADMAIPLTSSNNSTGNAPAGGMQQTSKWHCRPPINQMIESRDDMLTQHQSKNLIAGAAFRVWEELYVCKKPAIEEVFKVSLAAPASNAKAPDLTLTREQVIDASTRVWMTYLESERKCTYRLPWELHNQIQSKIQKVTGGLSRLASRSKVKKEESLRIKSPLTQEKAFEYTDVHVHLIKELWTVKRVQHEQFVVHNHRYVHQDWMHAEKELTRERGLWGPMNESPFNKWMLDTTEGPHRMRKKTMQNDLFYIQYPYRKELELPENRHLKYKVATSLDSKTYVTYCQQPLKVLCETEQNHQDLSGAAKAEKCDSLSAKEDEEAPASISLSSVPSCFGESHSLSHNDTTEDGEEEDEDFSTGANNQTLVRMLEEQEKITHMFRCARIQGLDTTEGLLLFGKEHCYVIDGFTVLKNREIMDIDSIPTGAHDPILPNPGSPRRSHAMRQCSKFAYEDIREVHKRRYLLQPMALEVFSGDGRNYLLSFPRKVRNKVYQRFMSTATSIADSAQQSVAGQKRTASVEQTSGIFSSLIGETSVTQRWVRGEISNFQYLMHLNTLAGRSYNDLMQYPVFPWILADYDSPVVDLNDPASFRDFSKPMGAQSVERLEQFQKRFKEWDDPHGETPPYHYGTHYSSAMIVCSYLVRLEPFTQHFLRLQGGHFDLADRLFHSIKEAWLSASRFNMADVKELIPEFFYLPEFLTNGNNFDLGTKQNGETVGHVVLPQWAKQDAREFIRVHRQALECDYVSQHLHQWIDLIFGHKQQGAPAVDAVNVFHHLFYEGNVDIYNIDDPLKKNATIGFINNFGQIPKQLFKKPHPSKKMNGSKGSVMDPNPMLLASATAPIEKLFFHNLDNLKPSAQPIKELKGPVGQIQQPDKAILAVEQNKVLMPPTFNKYIAWGFADHSLRLGMYDSDRAIFVCEIVAQNSGEILTCACPNASTVITAGTSSVVTIWQFDARRKTLTVKQSLHGHTDAVTCLAASPAYNVIVSGSRDGTAIIWDMSRYTFVRQLSDHLGVVAAATINELTGEIATCSGTWLHIWSINGDALASVNTSIGSSDRMQQILCVGFSALREWDSHNVVITGSTDGVVRMWSIDYVQVPLVMTNQSPAVRATSNDATGLKSDAVNLKKAALDTNKSDSEDCSISDEEENSVKEETTGEAAKAEKYPLSEHHLGPGEQAKKRPSLVSAKSLHERISNLGQSVSELKSTANISSLSQDDAGTSTSSPPPAQQPPKLRPSKSDTSITDSFVVIENVAASSTGQHCLRNGFKWQRQLMFRSKLTMHTAYDRKDNSEPASITALAVSKDHRVLYIGDARGRVFSWSVTEQPGRTIADHWLKDEGADQCDNCQVRFTLYERKHHCRNCGKVFCNKCSRFESEISRLKILKPVRVCQACYVALKQQQPSSPKMRSDK